jgi:hypothetical protein
MAELNEDAATRAPLLNIDVEKAETATESTPDGRIGE